MRRFRCNLFFKFLFCIILGMFSGCSSHSSGNVGNLQSYPTPSIEAPWIRAGEPIEFEGQLWFPKDGIESLQDSEVYLLGEYKNTQFFVDKLDVRPYDRIYTKFGVNKYRYFELN